MTDYFQAQQNLKRRDLNTSFLKNFSNADQLIMTYETVGNFAQKEIAPLNAKMQKDNAFPKPDPGKKSLWQKMGDHGLYGATIAQEWGGSGAGYVTAAIIVEEISRASGSVGLSFIAHDHLGCNRIAAYGTKEQKYNHLPQLLSGDYVAALAMSEPQAGSNVLKEMETNAIADNEAYKINGTKTWITNGGNAKIIVLYAKTPQSGQLLANAEVTAFIFDTGTPGFKPVNKLDKCGMRGSETWELSFQDAIIPKTSVLGTINKGKHVLMDGLNDERLMLAVGATGIAGAALDDVVAYAHTRHQFGSSLFSKQAYGHQLADMQAKLDSAREGVYLAAALQDKGQKVTNAHAARVFLQASQAAVDITQKAIVMCGGMGYTHDLPLAQYHSDALLYAIGGGTENIRRDIMWKSMTLA